MKNTVLALLIPVLTACAASTPQQAREMGPERRYVFQVDADYQTTYRRILDMVRSCQQANFGTASQLVSGDLYPDTRSGVVTVGMYGALGASIYQVIDVRGPDGMRTEVTAIFVYGPVEKMGQKVESWATAASSGC
jgi:hypothetical protein